MTISKKRKKNRIIVLVVCLFLLIGCGVFGYLAVNSLSFLTSNGENTTYKNENVIKSKDYYLRDNATDYQKELFKELKALCESEETDDLVMAECVAKNFIADYYTWTNKQGSFDVGGMSYVYSKQKKAFYNESRDYFYKYVTHYINKYGSENLIEVASLDGAAAYGGKKELDGVEYESYGVQLNITYKENSVFKSEDFATIQFMLFIKTEEGRFELVETYGNF